MKSTIPPRQKPTKNGEALVSKLSEMKPIPHVEWKVSSSDMLAILASANEDLKTITFEEFRPLKFSSKRFNGIGETLLKNFGTGKVNTENLDLILKHAGIERPKRETSHTKEQLQEILKSKDVDYSVITMDDFLDLEFDTPLFRGPGATLLSRSGNSINNEGLKKFLDSLGFVR